LATFIVFGSSFWMRFTFPIERARRLFSAKTGLYIPTTL
jgi:hypothetical protein